MSFEATYTEVFGRTVVKNLQRRGFDAYFCADKAAALAKTLELIPETDVVSWGGSVSIDEIGLREAVIARNPHINRDEAKDWDARVELMRKALLCDTFLMSTNAMSKDGELVNIDGNGNRVAALCYGPKQVIMIVGYNKIMPTLQAAQDRARGIAAPYNVTTRYSHLKTPCAMQGTCGNCTCEDTVCCQIVTTRHCRPAGRIKVIIVGEKLGF